MLVRKKKLGKKNKGSIKSSENFRRNIKNKI